VLYISTSVFTTFNSAAMSQQLSSALLRSCARQQLPTTVTRSAAIAAGQQRGVANASAKFESPFASSEDPPSTLKIPNFKKYTSKSSPTTNKVFSYFVAGTMGLGSAVGAKATVQGTS
jgi:ubiquinol-cytochrome c reductase iron-sulfur subunit